MWWYFNGQSSILRAHIILGPDNKCALNATISRHERILISGIMNFLYLTITFPSVSTVRSICVLINQHTFIYNTNVEIYTRDKSTQSIKTFSTVVYALFVGFLYSLCGVFWFALILRIFVYVRIIYDEVWYWYLI